MVELYVVWWEQVRHAASRCVDGVFFCWRVSFLVCVRVCVQESALAGRSLVVGYPGWLDSQGLEWKGRSEQATAVLGGSPAGREVCECVPRFPIFPIFL